jgi:hypothetical protein
MPEVKHMKSMILPKPAANAPAPFKKESSPARSPSTKPAGLPNKGAAKRG